MNTHSQAALKPLESDVVHPCPYCQATIPLEPAADYAPVYNDCPACGKRFIVERLREGFSVIRREGAPCMSDPECRICEMSQGDEE